MSHEEKLRAGAAIGIVAFAVLAWLAAVASPERFASYDWDMFGGRPYASLAVGAAVEVVALVCVALFFGRDPRGALAVGAAVGGAIGAVLSQYHPIMADPIARYLARPFSPALMLGFGEHVLGGAFVGSVIAYVSRRAARASGPHAPQAPPVAPAPVPAPASETNSASASDAQRYLLWGLLGVVGFVVAIWLCAALVGELVGPRVVRTEAEWQTVRDGERVEVRGTVGLFESDILGYRRLVVLDGTFGVWCEFDLHLAATSNFRDWREAKMFGAPVAVRGIAHRNPAGLKGCRPVSTNK